MIRRVVLLSVCIAGAMLPAQAAVPAAQEIFLRAQEAWQTRTIPAYEAFTLACADTFLSAACKEPGDDVQFVVRMSDGRTSATEIIQDLPNPLPSGGEDFAKLLIGGYIFGPGGAPLGFYRRIGGTAPQPPPPPNFAPDPLMKTIATVTTVSPAYKIQLVGEETVDGRLCYHLTLHPLLDPILYPLRDLWVDEKTYDVVALTYAWNFGDNHSGLVHYRFDRIGSKNIWAIVHIDAQEEMHGFFSNHTTSVSSDLRDIHFPTTEPASDFVPVPGY